MSTFKDIRARSQLSAAELQAAGEAIDKAQFAWQSQGNNPPLGTGTGGIAATDDADWFFGKITRVVQTSLLAARQYGFTEQVLKPNGQFIDASEPRKCDGTKNWAYTKDDAILSVGDYAVMRRSSYNPDLFEILFAVGGSLNVCGTPLQRRLTQPDDTSCLPCDITENDVETYETVEGISFDKCAFRVTPTGQCGGGSGDSAAMTSGSGHTLDVNAVLIELQGQTDTVAVPYEFIICPGSCTVAVGWKYLCYYKGLYLGTWFGPPATCDGGS